MLLTTTIAFGLAWWLGLYLIARDPRSALLVRAGLGLLTYALALAADTLRAALPGGGLAATVLAFVPAALWAGAAIRLLPEGPRRESFDTLWRLGLLPLSLAALGAAALSGALLAGAPAAPLYLALGALMLGPLTVCLGWLIARRSSLRPTGLFGVLIVVSLFLGLGTALLLLPAGLLPPGLALFGIGIDVGLLGVAVAVWDAFEAGETVRLDMLRSLLAAGGAGLLFGGLVAGAILSGAGAAAPMYGLLLASVAAAIAVQVLGAPAQRLVDRLAFAREPQLQAARAALRASEAALPRLSDTPHLAELDPTEFARLTRRALSHYGDLARLAPAPSRGSRRLQRVYRTAAPPISRSSGPPSFRPSLARRLPACAHVTRVSLARATPGATITRSISRMWPGCGPTAAAASMPRSTPSASRRLPGSTLRCLSAPSTTGRTAPRN